MESRAQKHLNAARNEIERLRSQLQELGAAVFAGDDWECKFSAPTMRCPYGLITFHQHSQNTSEISCMRSNPTSPWHSLKSSCGSR